MRSRSIKTLTLLVTSCLFWQAVCQITGQPEPWDSDDYWRLWYPLSFALSAIAGYTLRRDGWLAGTAITFAQLPVMWINSGTDSMLAVGLLLLCVLAVPPVAISALAGSFAVRRRTG